MNPEDLLSDVMDAIQKYCVLPSHHEYIAVTLWCAYNHFADAFDFAPRLIIRSAEKRSGKTRLLEIIGELVPDPIQAIDLSPAYIFRRLDKGPCTLILDEVDALFGTALKSAQHEDLRALLNAGFQKGKTIGRCVGPALTPTEYPTFAPAALAGIGRLPDTIEDRAVVVPMRRKARHEKAEEYRINRDRPVVNAIRDRLADWAANRLEDARDYATYRNVDMPVYDRAADVWEPLIIVAELAGEDWAALARDACKVICASAEEEDTEYSPGQQLLADIRTVFEADFMLSADLCNRLIFLPESSWNEQGLTPHRLARMLREYGIKPKHGKDGDRRGYYRREFRDAWTRYLPESSESSEVSVTPVDQQEYLDVCPDSFTDPTEVSAEASEEVSEQNPSSTHTFDSSDTSDTSMEGELVLAGNLTADQRSRVLQALARVKQGTN
jgi:hypothetical protein